jgi:hypothetical protein
MHRDASVDYCTAAAAATLGKNSSTTFVQQITH